MFLKIYILAVSAYPYFLKITVSPYRRTRSRIGVARIGDTQDDGGAQGGQVKEDDTAGMWAGQRWAGGGQWGDVRMGMAATPRRPPRSRW